jgi:outer membrane protein OmpA-like peptidoglycan-associated protein
MIVRSLVATLLLGGVAFATPVEITLKNQVPPGQKPSIEVKALTQLRQVRCELTRTDDGRTFTAASGALRENASASIPFGDGKAGHFHWKGKLIAVFPDGNQVTNEITFETATTGSLQVKYSRDRLDLDAHTLEVQLSRPAGSAELKVFSDDGNEIGTGEATFHGEPAGTWLKVPWTQKAGNVMRLELRATSSDGQATMVKLLPWSVRIAHEEVNFPTGSSVIPPTETGKLDASYGKIIEAVDKARKAQPDVQVKLFIAGHTDTVGNNADNKKLSLDRARAIAVWFRDRGLPLPISYAGFGEEALKVKTPDNTDEAANRRADYIVGVEEPLVARGVRASWSPLR